MYLFHDCVPIGVTTRNMSSHKEDSGTGGSESSHMDKRFALSASTIKNKAQSLNFHID